MSIDPDEIKIFEKQIKRVIRKNPPNTGYITEIESLQNTGQLSKSNYQNSDTPTEY